MIGDRSNGLIGLDLGRSNIEQAILCYFSHFIWQISLHKIQSESFVTCFDEALFPLCILLLAAIGAKPTRDQLAIDMIHTLQLTWQFTKQSTCKWPIWSCLNRYYSPGVTISVYWVWPPDKNRALFTSEYNPRGLVCLFSYSDSLLIWRGLPHSPQRNVCYLLLCGC